MPKIKDITDFNAPALDVYARLTENQLVNRADPENGLFIAESPNVIDRALDAGFVPVSMLLERKHIEGQAAGIIARCGDIPIYTAPLPVLTQLTGFPLTRGVLCAMRRRALPTVEQICAQARRIAVLENIMNPTNLGAIFRSAAALNMDAVLLTPGSTAARCVSAWGPSFRCHGPISPVTTPPGPSLACRRCGGWAFAAVPWPCATIR